MTDFSTEISSVHDVKVAICYILYKLDRAVSEAQLYEIAVNSEVINYFNYTEAMNSLIENGSISKEKTDFGNLIVLEEKGKLGSEYFSSYIPFYFRKRILRSAYSFFAKLDRESDTSIDICETSNGYEVRCAIHDANYDLLRVALYSPDEEQAELIKTKILLNPEEFYKKVIDAVLTNEEEEITIDIRD